MERDHTDEFGDVSALIRDLDAALKRHELLTPEVEDQNMEVLEAKKKACIGFLKAHFLFVHKRGFDNPDLEAERMKDAFKNYKIDYMLFSSYGKDLVRSLELGDLVTIATGQFDHWVRMAGREIPGTKKHQVSRDFADFWSPVVQICEIAARD